MDLTFLGTGAAFNPAMDNSNACFSQNGEFFLLDCGESTFGRIWDLPELLSATRISVVVTHLHCDHVGSLGSLVSYCRYVLDKPIRIVHPLDTVVQLLDLMGIERSNYEYLPLYPQHDGISFEPIEVEHVENMRCFGYIVTTGDTRFYYSGDSTSIPNTVLQQFLENKIERIYQDTSLHASDHPTHGTLEELERLFVKSERSRVFCIHLDSDFRSVLKEKGFGLVPLLPKSV